MLLLLTRPLAAQTPWAVAGGYSYLQDPPDRIDFPAGWIATASVALKPWLSVVGDVSGHKETALDIDFATFAVLGGARASASIGRLTEFGQLLAGVVRSTSTVVGITSSDHHPAIQPGAGVDYPIARRLAARLQIDYRAIRGGAVSPAPDPRHQLRYSVLLVYHGCCR